MTGDAISSSGTRPAHLAEKLNELTQALLSEADIEETLAIATDLLRVAADGDASLLFLPSVDNALTCEITAGALAAHLLGMPFTLDPSTMTDGEMVEDATVSQLGIEADLRSFGPMIVVALPGGGAAVVLRERGRTPFAADDLAAVQDCTSQVQLTLKLAEADDVKERAAILEERERISRDLHDYAIQEIFGVGIVLDRLLGQAKEAGSHTLAEGIEQGMRSLEDAILQIRRVVFTLHEPPADLPFSARLEEETSRSRRILGFAPSLVFDLDGFPVLPGAEGADGMFVDLNTRIDQAIASDAAAAVREALSNVARHANARSVLVNVSVSGRGIIGEMVMTIVDDGSGLAMETAQSSGLDNIGHRATTHGGSFAVGAGPRGRGTSLVWRVPLT